jgi:hypothetical protein
VIEKLVHGQNLTAAGIRVGGGPTAGNNNLGPKKKVLLINFHLRLSCFLHHVYTDVLMG